MSIGTSDLYLYSLQPFVLVDNSTVGRPLFPHRILISHFRTRTIEQFLFNSKRLVRMHFAVALGLLASAAGPALADSYGNFFRIPCAGRLVDERADPIISPGVVSQHVHEIAGGNAFNFTTTYNTTQQSSCSSCPVKKDLSNYWTPKLYWQAPNGSFFDVPRLGEGLGKRAGMTVYY